MKLLSRQNLWIAVCLLQLVGIAALLLDRQSTYWENQLPLMRAEQIIASAQRAGAAQTFQTTAGGPPTNSPTRVNAALERELTEAKRELTALKSEISFSYGSVRDSGRFVGTTLRKVFETQAAHDPQEASARFADNQLDIYSLGPFIRDAEVIEADPQVFAQFQTELVAETLEMRDGRSSALEPILHDFKSRAQKLEPDSVEWTQLNHEAVQKVSGLLSQTEKATMQPRLQFFEQYGLLIIPAYSVLRGP